LDDQSGEAQLPDFDEEEQISRFQLRLDAIRVDRRQALQIFAAAGGAAALAACGSSSKNNNNTTKTTTNSAPATQAAAVASAPAASGSAAAASTSGSPASGGATKASQTPGPVPAGVKLAANQTFKYNLTLEPDSHDFNKDLYCNGEAALFAGLAQFNPDLEPIPDMAKSWDVNSDGTVFTFHMRTDTKWSNGQPVTAKDFDYSFRRQLNPATKAPYASFLYDIKNAQAYNTGKLPDDSTLGIKVIDDQTLQVTMEHPAGYFPAIVAYNAALPAYKDAVDKYGDDWTHDPAKIVSNGAFKLTKWDHNKVVEIQKNDGYWNAANIHLQTVSRPIIGADQEVTSYENGEIDYADRVGVGDYKRIFADPKLSKEAIKYSLDGTWYLVPEADKPPFDTMQVRQAMAHAIDRDTIVKNVLQGIGSVAYTFNPPGTPGFNPATYDEFTKFDAQKAKDLLKGTPYEGGKNWPKITMSQRNNEGDGPVNAGDAIIQMLSDTLGMKIDHEVGDPKDIYNRMYQRKLQLIWLRWYEDYPDPNDEQNLVFWSKAGGDSGHRQAWHDDKYDALIVQAAGETDPKKRLDLYAQADQIMAQQAGAIFVYYPQNVGLLKPTIGGMPKDRQGTVVPTWNIFVRMYDYLYVTG
jgi:ABC-type oligopeptide transport system substrate-binding subunit